MNDKQLPQKILVFQQNGSGESKIKGIMEFGVRGFSIEIVSIDKTLPPVVDNPEEYLPRDIQADLVLDFLEHPDLSYELAVMCSHRKIPVVASGKKLRVSGVRTPPT